MAASEHSRDEDLLVALRHPLRRRILREMADGEPVSPRQLSTALRHPLSNVSYHVRVLADHAAVTLVETQPARGSEQHFYRCSVTAPWAWKILGIGDKDGGVGEEESGAAPI
ncbi:MAG TPA: helix-turn-helix domain-containing protein [Solirubrobacterales bacterium]|nr:helix-turn-helix domain-containing protein [Solirubrobacterales bacterium]